jgi:hypothetical protein
LVYFFLIDPPKPPLYKIGNEDTASSLELEFIGLIYLVIQVGLTMKSLKKWNAVLVLVKVIYLLKMITIIMTFASYEIEDGEIISFGDRNIYPIGVIKEIEYL